LVLLGTIVAYRRGRRAHDILITLGLLTVALLQVQALKVFFERDRPGIVPWAVAGGAGYPSGHVANAAICAVAAYVLMFRGRTAPALRAAAIAAGTAYVVAIGYARIYLGRHWVTDVLGAILLALAFWGVTFARAPRWPRVVAALFALQFLGLYLSAAA